MCQQKIPFIFQEMLHISKWNYMIKQQTNSPHQGEKESITYIVFIEVNDPKFSPNSPPRLAALRILQNHIINDI